VVAGNIAKVSPDDRADATPAAPVGDDLKPGRIKSRDQIVPDAVGDRFIKNPLIAETLVIEFEAFELDAQALCAGWAGFIAERDLPKVRMTRHRAARGELLSDMLDDKGRIGRADEGFQKAWVRHGRGRKGCLDQRVNPQLRADHPLIARL